MTTIFQSFIETFLGRLNFMRGEKSFEIMKKNFSKKSIYQTIYYNKIVALIKLLMKFYSFLWRMNRTIVHQKFQNVLLFFTFAILKGINLLKLFFSIIRFIKLNYFLSDPFFRWRFESLFSKKCYKLK